MNRVAVGSLIIGFLAALVLLVLSLSARSDEPGGEIRNVTWLAEDIDGRGVIDNAQTTLTIDADGSANGSGGCNRFTTSATIAGSNLSFKPAAATRMMCPPALMDQEQSFFPRLNGRDPTLSMPTPANCFYTTKPEKPSPGSRSKTD
ncbi:heat shock protein HslJ [Phyllobacterium sp. 1468]|uniref:META domain-containing protein n=1 Tax=Phyllobacterium sp. 1468 TaxID=2817759 RepID=UPI00285C48F4|nr:META domain-containing protein [Phyllobacterium sp. 1468]MDR6633976.1 heat shock protein HslJ [Phyllobacterium sp. 1468]